MQQDADEREQDELDALVAQGPITVHEMAKEAVSATATATDSDKPSSTVSEEIAATEEENPSVAEVDAPAPDVTVRR